MHVATASSRFYTIFHAPSDPLTAHLGSHHASRPAISQNFCKQNLYGFLWSPPSLPPLSLLSPVALIALSGSCVDSSVSADGAENTLSIASAAVVCLSASDRVDFTISIRVRAHCVCSSDCCLSGTPENIDPTQKGTWLGGSLANSGGSCVKAKS